MKPGVFLAQKKDGTIYYRSSITYKNKHISLGSFTSEDEAHQSYNEATMLLNSTLSLEDVTHATLHLAFDKVVTLINFRDNGLYIGTPIYLRKNYFSYYLSENE